MAVSAQFGGIDVEVISNGQLLPLYDDPDAEENEEPRIRQHYIEAVTGAMFSVKVTLGDTFEMGHCDAARVSISFDGEENEWYSDISRASGLNTRPSQGRQVTLSRISYFDKDLRQWRSGNLCFGALAITETTRSNAFPVKMQKLGQIQLKLVRVRHGKTVKTPMTVLNRVGEVSEKVMKGKAIANTVDCVDYAVSKEPPTSVEACPIKGHLGQPLLWNISYRSKRTLQMLGCIPKTPSPAPESIAVTDRGQEMKALRARLALLEGEANVKSENAKPPAGIKRERNYSELTRSRKKSRRSHNIEVVDLTVD